MWPLFCLVRVCVVLRNFAKPIRKHPRLSLFFKKVADLRPATLLKMRLRHVHSSLNPMKPPRTSSPQNTSGRLLSAHKSSFHYVGPSNVKPCNGFEFSHTSFWSASHFVYSLVERLMSGKCISAVL